MLSPSQASISYTQNVSNCFFCGIISCVHIFLHGLCLFLSVYLWLLLTQTTLQKHNSYPLSRKKKTSGECLEPFHPLGTHIPFH